MTQVLFKSRKYTNVAYYLYITFRQFDLESQVYSNKQKLKKFQTKISGSIFIDWLLPRKAAI